MKRKVLSVITGKVPVNLQIVQYQVNPPGIAISAHLVLTQRSGGSKLKRVDSPQKGKGSCKRSNEPLHESLSKKRSNWRDRATNRERKLHAIWELPIARCIIGASNVQNTASKHFPVADTKLRKKRKYVI